MGIFRNTQPPPAERKPHPDSRVEAELQRVLALQRAITRTEARLKNVRDAQWRVDEDLREYAGQSPVQDLAKQAGELRKERADLEASLLPMHEEIARRLADLGDYALYLYGPTS
jgi:hypothetical protein